MNGRDDRGIAAVWAVALAYLLILVAIVVGGFAGVAAARMKAATVADLAAIAAVQGAGCGSAAEVVEGNDLSLTACGAHDGDVVVEVAAPPPLMLIRLMDWLGQSPPVIRVSVRAGLG